MKSFAIRLEAAACPNPFGGAALPALSEEFTVAAADRATAYKASHRQMTLPLMGQELRIYIDGTEQLGSH